MYGSHPFYLATNNKGDAFGGFLHNSNAMDVTIKDRSITFRTIGGVIDMFIFSGPCPASVVS